MPTVKPAIMKNLSKNFAPLKPVGIRQFDYQASYPGIIKLTLGEPASTSRKPWRPPSRVSRITTPTTPWQWDGGPAQGHRALHDGPLRQPTTPLVRSRSQSGLPGIYASLTAVTNPGDGV